MRAFGEWEKQELIFLALPHENTDWNEYLDEILNYYANLVRIIAKYQKVVVVSPNKKDFEKYFKDVKNVEFYMIDTNDTWIRDYGAIDVKNGNKIVANDFKFNAWGGKFQSQKDNEVNDKLFKNFNGDVIKHDLVLEGGSIDFNGNGTMLTTTKCLLNQNRKNGLTKEGFNKIFFEIFGVKDVIWLENGFIKGDDTDSHVDTLARFIDENTIAYSSCDDKDDEHYTELKKMENELKQTNFNLISLPIPKPIFYNGVRIPATYANFVFVNGALIVPIYSDKNDEIVLNKLKKALPNIDVIGVDSRVLIRQNGSIHCSTQNRFFGKR